MVAAVHVESPGAKSFRSQLIKPALLRAYFLAKLPLGAIAGLKIVKLDGESCEAAVPFGWITKNPFGSIYFAALTMAAELSCAGLALQAARGAPDPVSVLPIGLNGSFEKKATALTTFTCNDGKMLFDAVNRALETGEAVVVETNTVGRMPDQTIAARFNFTWSFKRKASR
jgi:hypothetical protein